MTAKEAEGSARRRVPAAVLLYPAIGLLAVGNAVFLLLWLLTPMAKGPSGGEAGRRIEVRAGDGVLELEEGLVSGEPAVGVRQRLPGKAFEDFSRLLLQLAKAPPTMAEPAKDFFGSEAGKGARPAVTFLIPQGTGEPERLEVYAIDVRRELCYCRTGAGGEPVAFQAAVYRQLASKLAELGGQAVGRFDVPYFVPLGDSLRGKLAGLSGPLSVWAVASDPAQRFYQFAGQQAGRKSIQIQQIGQTMVAATLELSEAVPITRAFAEAMGQASEKVAARALDFAGSRQQIEELAQALKRPVADIEEALVLQYGERVRVIPSQALFGQGAAQGEASRFVGESVVEKALDDLVAERGMVYFAFGHGERRIADEGNPGYRRAADQLASRGFRTASLDLAAATPAIPKDCRVLVVPGPKKAWSPEAEAAVSRYAEAGGRLAILLDPPDGQVVLAGLLGRHGITVPEPRKAIARNMPDLPNDFIQVELLRRNEFVRGWTRQPVIFVTACGLEVSPAPAGAPWEVLRVAQPVILVTGQRPPCVVAAVVPAAGGRGPKMLVFGDVDAFSNQVLHVVPDNGQLLVEAFAWLAE